MTEWQGNETQRSYPRDEDEKAGPGQDDKRARFEETALPFLDKVYSASMRLTHNQEDASDIVQETFLRAYRTFENFTAGTNCKAWLLKIMYSVFVNKYHRKKREPYTVSLDEEFHHAETDMERHRDHIEMQMVDSPGFSVEVEEALGSLSEVFRSAVLLVDVEELSYEEAAQVLNCAVGTVRSRLFRGRRTLVAELQKRFRPSGNSNAVGRRHKRREAIKGSHEAPAFCVIDCGSP